jgi:CBS-domain-containing membrane protein
MQAPSRILTDTAEEKAAKRAAQRPVMELARGDMALAAIGMAAAVICVSGLAVVAEMPMVLGSFGSSCVLLFGYPKSPFCRPRNFIGGHMVSSAVGLACLHVSGPEYWMMGVAVAAAFVAMQITGTIHPPAGGNPIILFLMNADWGFLWFPTLAGTVVVQAVALVHLWILRKRGSWPRSKTVN